MSSGRESKRWNIVGTMCVCVTPCASVNASVRSADQPSINTIGTPIAAGAASGLLLAWMINLSLASLFGHSVRFALPVEFVAILISGAVAIVLSAALAPAWRAARVNPMETLRNE